MSAADPWIGEFTATRSAAILSVLFWLLMARIRRRLPMSVVTNPFSFAVLIVSFRNLSTALVALEVGLDEPVRVRRPDLQPLREAERGHAVDHAEVDGLSHAALVRGDLGLGNAEDQGRGLPVDVLPLPEGLEEDRVLRKVGQDGKLDLRVVGADEPHARRRHEGGADAPSLLLADGDVLEVGVLARQAPGGRAGLDVVRVQAPRVLVHQERERVDVGRLQLGELAVRRIFSGTGSWAARISSTSTSVENPVLVFLTGVSLRQVKRISWSCLVELMLNFLPHSW